MCPICDKLWNLFDKRNSTLFETTFLITSIIVFFVVSAKWFEVDPNK